MKKKISKKRGFKPSKYTNAKKYTNAQNILSNHPESTKLKGDEKTNRTPSGLIPVPSKDIMDSKSIEEQKEINNRLKASNLNTKNQNKANLKRPKPSPKEPVAGEIFGYGLKRQRRANQEDAVRRYIEWLENQRKYPPKLED